MGNFEKMVVLAVLILSAIVLAVSLNDDGNEVEATGPLSAAAQRIEEQSPDPLPTSVDEGPGYTLFGEVKPEPMQAPVPDPGGDPVGQDAPALAPALGMGEIPLVAAGSDARILKSTRGLTPSALDDFMVYDVVAGDTWNRLAMQFYGDVRHATVLRMANEEGELQVDAQIFVPVYDFGREARADRQPLAPEEPVALLPEEAPPAAPAIGGVYVVQNGDSLSRIAVKAYGNGKLWRPIYDANRDHMRSPDWLQVGMKLVIPDPDQAQASVPRDPDKPRVR